MFSELDQRCLFVLLVLMESLNFLLIMYIGGFLMPTSAIFEVYIILYEFYKVLLYTLYRNQHY
jgi:hypothetical protein